MDDHVYGPGCCCASHLHLLHGPLSCALLLMSCPGGAGRVRRTRWGKNVGSECNVELVCVCEAWPVVCSSFLTLHVMVFLSWFSSPAVSSLNRLSSSSLFSTDSPTSDSAKSKVSFFSALCGLCVPVSLTPPLTCRVPGARPRISAPETSWSPPFSRQPAAREGSRRRNLSPAARTTTSTPCSSRRRS